LGCLKATGEGEGDQSFKQGFTRELLLIPGTQYRTATTTTKIATTTTTTTTTKW
jgi:hypothetical protein